MPPLLSNGHTDNRSLPQSICSSHEFPLPHPAASSRPTVQIRQTFLQALRKSKRIRPGRSCESGSFFAPAKACPLSVSGAEYEQMAVVLYARHPPLQRVKAG